MSRQRQQRWLGRRKASTSTPTPPPTSSWVLTATDDFRYGTLPSGWTKYNDSQPGGDPYGWFNAENIVMVGGGGTGHCQIKGRWDPVKLKWGTGGMGRWNLPSFTPPLKVELDFWLSADADGYLKSFLLWPAAGNWPVGGEIDYFETIDEASQSGISVYHYGSGNTQIQHDVTHDFTQPTTVSVEWTPGLIVNKVNGVEFGRVTGSSIVVTNPMIPTLQMQANDDSPWNEAASLPTEGAHITQMRFYNQG